MKKNKTFPSIDPGRSNATHKPVRAAIPGSHGLFAPALSLVLSLAFGLAWSPLALAAAREASSLWIVGIEGHDQGPASDHHEHGVDLNMEVMFTPLNMVGSPRPHLGTTLNFAGDTSVLYAGLTFSLYDSRRWFGNGFVGAVVHNGPLHKDPVGCEEESDCGFGVRVMPRFGLEWGYYVSPEAAVSLHYDHMSHKGIISGENEGIDHLGIRYRHPF